MTSNDIFDELFVLELANNHLGDVRRGLKIIGDYSQLVRFNNVRAAIKLQFRDVDSFIHGFSSTGGHPLHQKNHRHSPDSRGFCGHGESDPGRQLYSDGNPVR